jgi:hypothetical protein
MSTIIEEREPPLTKLEQTFRDLVTWVMFDSVFGKRQAREGHVLVSGTNQQTRKVRFEKTYWLRDLDNFFGARVGYVPSIVLTLRDTFISIEQHTHF